jgi:hypothetical protein
MERPMFSGGSFVRRAATNKEKGRKSLCAVQDERSQQILIVDRLNRKCELFDLISVSTTIQFGDRVKGDFDFDQFV